MSWSPISEEGRLLSNKYKGVMASYWLFLGINTGLHWYLTLREGVHICECWCVITHFPSLISPFLTANLIHRTKKSLSRLNPSGCLFQLCVIYFHALTSPYMDTVCASTYQWESSNSSSPKMSWTRQFHSPCLYSPWNTTHTHTQAYLLSKAPTNHFTGSWSVNPEPHYSIH